MDFLELLKIDTKLGHFISDFVSSKNVMKSALSYRIQNPPQYHRRFTYI